MNVQTALAQTRGSKQLLTAALALIAAGALLSGLAWAGDGGQARFGFAWLWGFAFVWSVALGSLFFVALHHLAHALRNLLLFRNGGAQLVLHPHQFFRRVFNAKCTAIVLPNDVKQTSSQGDDRRPLPAVVGGLFRHARALWG